MSAAVTRRHRDLVVRALQPSRVHRTSLIQWLESGEDQGLMLESIRAEDTDALNRMAQALADIEAETLASKPMLYEAHGKIITGPPGNTTGTGCLLCDMVQTIGPHDPECSFATRVGGENERAKEVVIVAAREVDNPPYGGMSEARRKLRAALSELDKVDAPPSPLEAKP
jgi:hypothetical protein